MTSSPRLKAGVLRRNMLNTFTAKLVHASMRIALRVRRHASSSIRSTRFDRVSLGSFYILGSIFITVVFLTTFRTCPASNVQRQTFNNMPTTETALATWEPAINNTQIFPVPFAFISQHSTKHAHANIRNSAGKAMVSNHAANIQVLYLDTIKSTHKVSGNFVQPILTRVGNMLMYSSYLDSLAVPPTTILLATRKDVLLTSELGQLIGQVFWIGYSFSVRESSKSIDTKIDANPFASLRHELNVLIKAESYEIPPRRSLGYRGRRGFTGEFPAPMDVESTKTGNTEVLILRVPLECAVCVFRRLCISFFLECRIFAGLVPEVDEGSLQMSQSLLRRHTGNFAKPLGFFLSFQLREQCGCFMVANAFLLVLPSVCAQSQSPVVNVPTCTKDASKRVFLQRCWIESGCISDFHMDSIPCVNIAVKNYFKEIFLEAAIPLHG